ncbi:MAM domain containing glycosylphosphatidylinositol anchor protein 1 [Dissostichus eleginoides]|uniref:MAM domain containing glycosylphosphatidylinositol anchor protein 1 n=1 Tax=Dissostichus eleginoides TaxID=100907 RepID=A0AAD9FMN3_DISEL|nr:MAM domain containing glycosylphosphatidylinositol anchor protein 1 [Dissostichus eleginoides]
MKFGEGLVQGDIPWLTLKAANGLHLPYIGYALLDFEINGVKVMGKGVVVVEDSYLQQECALLGMNVIGDCWQSIFQDGHQGEAAFRSTLPPTASTAWGKAFVVCRRVGLAGSPTELQRVAKLPRQSTVLVPPETEMIIWTQVPQAVGTPDCCVMVENLQNDDQEWRVARTLSWVRSGRVPIRVDLQAVKTEEELVLTHTGPPAVEVEAGDREVDGQASPGSSSTLSSPRSRG